MANSATTGLTRQKVVVPDDINRAFRSAPNIEQL